MMIPQCRFLFPAPYSLFLDEWRGYQYKEGSCERKLERKASQVHYCIKR